MILFGDLNYRLELENNLCRKLIKEGNLLQLSKKDQFNKAKVSNKQFHYIEEGPLNFNPTYKFNFNTNDYDTSKKNRTPAWCDRILYDTDSSLTQIYYGRSELKLSDHRPVFGLFEVKVRRINEEAKNEIEEKLIQKFKSLYITSQSP